MWNRFGLLTKKGPGVAIDSFCL